MAYDTARSRWPVTVQKMVDDCEQTAKETDKGSPAQEEMKHICGQLRELKRSIQEDRKLLQVNSMFESSN